MTRRTKIVCTIGPASSSRARLNGLLSAGMDVARLNFSHGTHAEHAGVIEKLRACAANRARPLALLQDLSGPKVRLGLLPQPIVLKRGQEVRFVLSENPLSPADVSLPVPELLHALTRGDRLLADDGQIELRVVSVGDDSVIARTVNPGILNSRKGITAPGVALNINAVTEKDLDDLRFGLQQGVDWIAASYIRRAEDLRPLRAEMARAGIHRPIIAKIEKMEAVRNIQSIIGAADGIMVARGDLGVEIPIDEVPMFQKQIIALCRRSGKPVITATQMLESMIHNPRPTRAEVTDVANAILDGSDAVMLSAETAVGEYPIETVRMMARVATRADAAMISGGGAGCVAARPDVEAEAVAHAAVELACAVKAAAIVCATTSGSTALLIARYRPAARVIAVTPHQHTYHRLALTWGAVPVLIPPVSDTDEMMHVSVNSVEQLRLVTPGDKVVLTAGVPVGVVGNTNLIKLHVVGQPV